MIPDIGSEWKDRDGRKMRVDEVIIAPDPANMPWCKMTVLNPVKLGTRQPCQPRTLAAKFTSDF